jgi:pimeloyl-ACP methyl ester carboxylesterase
VNVPSSDFPQYDITVSVKNPQGKAIAVRSRYIVAQKEPPQLPPFPVRRGLAEEPTPSIPADSEVLLFLHGMDSRAEEATDITNQLFLLRQKNPGKKNLVVISVDLPTSGYADNIDHFRISPLEAIGTPKDLMGNPVAYALAAKNKIAAPDFSFTGQTPLLDFIENFVVAFVETLDTGPIPGVKGKIKAVMGGSLGGNMTFRLGRRCRSERAGPCAPGEASNMSWLPNFIVWSPASIWNSFGESQGISINIDWNSLPDANFKEAWQNFAHGSNFDPTGVTKHLGPLTALLSANNLDPSDPNDLLTPERASLRREFLESWDNVIVPLLVPMAQSDTWQSDYFPCKKSMIVGARLDRQETYDPNFLRWHWRLGAEQLLYSHQSVDQRTPGQPRFLSNVKPMLLACGTEDRVLFNDICGATQRTAPYMTTTPGRAIFLQKTGHSVDNERREYFARQIIDFLDVGVTSAPKKANGAACFLPDECASGRCQFFKCEAQPPPAPKKANGAACFLSDECASGRCQFFKCEAQPSPPPKKANGNACFLPDECASGRCQFFKCQAQP